MTDYIAEAIEEAWGERCPDFNPECHCCRAWKQYDDLRAYILTEEELLACLEAGDLARQVEHWKANHAEAVRRKREKDGIIRALRVSLAETLEVATRNEEGEYADRARSLLARYLEKENAA